MMSLTFGPFILVRDTGLVNKNGIHLDVVFFFFWFLKPDYFPSFESQSFFPDKSKAT